MSCLNKHKIQETSSTLNDHIKLWDFEKFKQTIIIFSLKLNGEEKFVSKKWMKWNEIWSDMMKIIKTFAIKWHDHRIVRIIHKLYDISETSYA